MDSEMGFRHSIQADGILMILALTVAVELVAFVLNKFLIELKPGKEEEQTRKNFIEMSKKAEALNLPSTFIEYAKMSREAGKLEKELMKMQEERTLALQAQWRKTASKLLGFRMFLCVAAVFFLYEPTLAPSPLLEASSAWMWPYSRVLALPNYSSGALSCTAWLVLCQKVVSRMLKSI